MTPAQHQALLAIPARFPPERIDRIWIFPPQLGKSRESGLFVLSLLPEEGERPEQRILITLRYEVEQGSGRGRRTEVASEEGRAPPEGIERVIAGVLARVGEGGEPQAERIEGKAEWWAAMVGRLGASA